MLVHMLGPSSGPPPELLGLQVAFLGPKSYTETEKQKYRCGGQNPFTNLLPLLQVYIATSNRYK